MIIELVTTAAVIGVGGFGTYKWAHKKGMTNPSEYKSIKNIRHVLEVFVQDEYHFAFEYMTKGDNEYHYEKENFIIKIVHIGHNKVGVSLIDTDLQRNKAFFYFSYNMETLELLEVKEGSGYYKEYGYYEQYAELFRDFMYKVMNINWLNLETAKKEKLHQKYKKQPVSLSVVKDGTTSDYSIEHTKNPVLSQKLSVYKELYEFITIRLERLELEEQHNIDRDFKQVNQLIATYELLHSPEQETYLDEALNRIESKIEALEKIKEHLSNETAFEFKKISEMMK